MSMVGNVERAEAAFAEAGLTYEVKCSGTHIVVYCGMRTFDFYPTTGLYMRRGGGKRGNGLDDFMRIVGGG